MSFARPDWFWLLALVPLWAMRAMRSRARRDEAWVRIGQLGRPCSEGSAGWLLAAVCVIVALAQPRWGRTVERQLPPGHDVVLAIDVSRSMGARDAVPDRLGVAVAAAQSFVKALGLRQGDRLAVVAFAGRGVLRCPLTENLGAASDILRSLRPGEIQPGETDLGAALATALDAFDEQDHAEGRSIVIFSDGEDQRGVWQNALRRAQAEAVIVHAVAIGDAETGATVPTHSGTADGSEPLRYKGEIVISKRVDRPLETIATATGGAMLKLGLVTSDLGTLYRERIEPEARSRREANAPGERAERFEVFLLTGLVLFLVALWPKRARWRARRAWVAGPALALGALGAGTDANSPSALVAAGRTAYEAGRYEEAAARFGQAIDRAPGDPVPRFDAASALFQLQHYAEAADRYAEARELAGAALRTKIDYALGNTAAALGMLAEAIQHYDDCIASTAVGPGLDDVKRDAVINRAFVIEHAKRARSRIPNRRGARPGRRSQSARSAVTRVRRPRRILRGLALKRRRTRPFPTAAALAAQEGPILHRLVTARQKTSWRAQWKASANPRNAGSTTRPNPRPTVNTRIGNPFRREPLPRRPNVFRSWPRWNPRDRSGPCPSSAPATRWPITSPVAPTRSAKRFSWYFAIFERRRITRSTTSSARFSMISSNTS